MQGVLSGTRNSRAAEHHSKMTRGQGDFPRAQHLKMWKQFGSLCMRIVGEPLRTLLKSIVKVSYGTEQAFLTCDLNMHCVAAKFMPRLLTPKRKNTVLQFVKSFVSVPWMTHPSCRGSSLGMRVGSTGMIPRLNNSPCNGRAQDPQDRRRRGRATA